VVGAVVDSVVGAASAVEDGAGVALRLGGVLTVGAAWQPVAASAQAPAGSGQGAGQADRARGESVTLHALPLCSGGRGLDLARWFGRGSRCLGDHQPTRPPRLRARPPAARPTRLPRHSAHGGLLNSCLASGPATRGPDLAEVRVGGAVAAGHQPASARPGRPLGVAARPARTHPLSHDDRVALACAPSRQREPRPNSERASPLPPEHKGERMERYRPASRPVRLAAPWPRAPCWRWPPPAARRRRPSTHRRV